MIRNNVALAERVARATPHVLAEGRELKRYILGATPQDGCQVPKKNNKITEEEEEGMLRRHSERLSEEKAATSARARVLPLRQLRGLLLARWRTSTRFRNIWISFL